MDHLKMNDTPKNTDSGYFDTSCSVSTPSLQNDNTPLPNTCRKRKASFIGRNLSEVMDCYSPQFSSTLNESLLNHLEKINLQNDQETDKISSIESKPSNKQLKTIENRKFCSVPNTPEQQVKYTRDSISKRANTNSFVKNFSQFGIQSQSPLNKEAYNILYPELPSLEPIKKPATPLKIEKGVTQAKKRLFYPPRQSPLKQILSNSIIMNKILKQLSNGDLYRLAKVSIRFKDAILNDYESSSRFLEYTQLYRHHKENYRITPPNSPEKDDEMDVEGSPGSKNFVYFCQIAKGLNKNQTLMKCPKCQKPSIVENEIAQCQDINRCGYIFCKKCDSFSNHPKDFKDKCNNAQLLNATKSRNLFGDLSNSTMTSDYGTGDSSSFFSSSLNLNSSCKHDSSEMFSQCEVSTPKQKVKRNLSKSFLLPSEVKIFSSNTRIGTPRLKKQPRRASLVPVVPLEPPKQPILDLTEPSSPPKVKQHSVCSKQSKRNLKRCSFTDVPIHRSTPGQGMEVPKKAFSNVKRQAYSIDSTFENAFN